VTTYTPTGRPFIDQLIPGRLFVAAGGCGAAAKSSDEIGRLAAELVEQESWSEAELPASLFEAERLG
jgi:sarcosine oxidase